MALPGLTTYKDYLDLMVQYRKNMGELYDSTNPVDKETYWKNRELIKQLRYHALTENIDLYSLEFDAKSIIKKEALNKEIVPAEEALAKAKQTVLDEDRKAQAEIAAGRVPDYSKMQAAQKQVVDLNNKLSKLYEERASGYTPEEQKSYERYIKEAYLVKEMVDIRERYERATDAEKIVLAEQAYQIRLQVNALLLATNDGVDDFERRVWLMYYGRDISLAPKGTEDYEIWQGHLSLMHKATSDYKKMKPDDQKKLDPLKTDAQIFEEKYGDAGRNMWRERKYETFSGADMVVYFAFPGHRPVDIGTASLISYSIYREKKQVRTIGAINTKGITKGPRTVSGRMVFTVVREHIVEMIKRELPYLRGIKNIIMDELPPFDILVSFGNEYGASAGLVIQGVTLVDEQKTLTVDDLFTENIFTYLARDIDVMKNMAASVFDPYDPIEWYTGQFIPMGSEILGNFKPKELQVYRSGEYLSDPAPFYGAAAGWNSKLYDLIYEGGEVVDGGNGSGGIGGSKPPDPKPPEEVIPPKDTGTSMDYESTKPFLWAAGTYKDLKAKNMFVAGYTGYRPEISESNRKKLNGKQDTSKLKNANQWSYMGESSMATGPTTMKTNVLLDIGYDAVLKKIEDTKWVEKSGNNGSMQLTLKMYNKARDNYASILDTTTPVIGDVKQEFKVHMTWDYYAPNYGDYDNSSLSVNYTKADSRKYTEIGVLGFWKKKLPFSDMVKALQYLWKDTTVGYWTKWADRKKVPATEIKAGQKTQSKGSIIVGGMAEGKYGVDRIWNDKLSNAKGATITVPEKGVTIDLKKYLYFVSSIAPITGQRYVLDFSDLPKEAIVVCKFVYSLDKPSDPINGGNKKTLFVKIYRSKIGDGIGNNGYTMNTGSQIAGEQAIAWSECNEAFRKNK